MTRLIDADVLKASMMADSLQMMLFGQKYELSDALRTVNNAPSATIDAILSIAVEYLENEHLETGEQKNEKQDN